MQVPIRDVVYLTSLILGCMPCTLGRRSWTSLSLPLSSHSLLNSRECRDNMAWWAWGERIRVMLF